MKASIVKVEIIDPAAEEALVTVSDGRFSCVAYDQPSRVRVGDPVTLPLSALSSENIFFEPRDTLVGFIPGEPPFGWKVVAVVSSAKKRLVRVGAIELKVGEPFPGDVEDGQTISFSCDRIGFVK